MGDKANEIKMLQVIERANELFFPIDLIANYCGAHSVPSGVKSSDYVLDIVNNQLPTIKALKLKTLKQIDVFHENGIFDFEQTKQILTAGIVENGLIANFHGDELSDSKSAQLGCEMNERMDKTVVHAISHLEKVNDAGIEMLGESEIAAVMLPTTCHVLNIHIPPYKALKNADCIIAFGSDFNPNAHCMSMPMVMNLSCNLFRCTMNESMIASTLNSAYALGQSELFGSLEKGKYGDFVVVGHENWQHIIYEMSNHPIKYVYKKGMKVVDNNQDNIKRSK